MSREFVSWQVAGVDYAVGVPAGTVLKDPMTINMAGVSLDVADQIANVTGNNVVLSGYHFSLRAAGKFRLTAAAAPLSRMIILRSAVPIQIQRYTSAPLPAM